MRSNLMLALACGLAVMGLAACDGGSDPKDDGGACARTCAAHADCPRGSYCDPDGCCRTGCAFDQDCAEGVCNPETHQCEAGDGGQTGDDGGQTGDDGGQTGDDGGQTGDDGGQTGDDGGQGEDQECLPTHDRPLGAACECHEQCVPEYPTCFADVLNDPGPLYCTLSFQSQDCSGQVCPAGYQCNDFYLQADPPQPPFCQKCLGGPRALGESCLCDSDCGAAAPACFRDVTASEETPASCTILGCTTGEQDDCPGTFECSASLDFQTQAVIYYCKACNPGDHSLADGTECGCHKDCPVGSICTKPLLSQDPKRCSACLGGEPRGFGAACQCDSDCGLDFPTCLVNSKYCSKLGCTGDQDCPPEGHCKDLWGFASFCEKD
jgi:hypothetical protein